MGIVFKDFRSSGFVVEKILAIGKYVVLKIVFKGREAIAYIPTPCLRSIGKEDCVKGVKDLELEYIYSSRVKSSYVVKFIDLIDFDDFKVLIREFVRSTLREEISRGGLDLRRVLEVSIDIARGLGDIHKAGLVYTDLKPENVGIDSSGKTVLLDLDAVTPPFTKPRFITYEYAPPEYLSNGIVVYESDTYQLALLILKSLNIDISEIIERKVMPCIGLDKLNKLLKSMLNPIPFLRPRVEDLIQEFEKLSLFSRDRQTLYPSNNTL